MYKRGCIVSKLLARMMVNAGVNHLVTMDLHQKEIQGFFDIPVDNLRASPFLLQYITQNVRHTFHSCSSIYNPLSIIIVNWKNHL